MSFLKEYQQMVEELAAPADAACSRIRDLDEEGRAALSQMFLEIASMEHNIDGFKKFLFYGKPFQPDLIMTEMVDEMMSPLKRLESDPVRVTLLHAVLGIASESIELLSAILKDEVDMTNVAEELGDAAWYVTLAASACGTGLEQILAANMKKLRARYGQAWSQGAALNRDADAERSSLEQTLEARGNA